MADIKMYKYGYDANILDQLINMAAHQETTWGYFRDVANDKNYALRQLFIKKEAEYSLEDPLEKQICLYLESGSLKIKLLDREGKECCFNLEPQETLLIPKGFLYNLLSQEESFVYIFSSPLWSQAEKSFFEKSKTFDYRNKHWAEEIQTIISQEFAGKKICFKKDSSSSLHFHCQKTETYFIHSGKLLLRLRAGQGEDRFFVLKPGQSIQIKPGLMHQAGGLTDTTIIEISTRDEDSDSFLVEAETMQMPRLKEEMQIDGDNLILANNNLINVKEEDKKLKNKNMKIFLDTANLDEIEKGLRQGILSGITTNPALIAKEPKSDFLAHISKIIDLCRKYNQEIPLSIEVFRTDPDEMISQAKEFVSHLNYSNLNIKIPMGWPELRVIRELSRDNVNVNCTCGFSEAQAVLAANAGARYFSFFCGRMKDIDVDPFQVIENTRQLLEGSQTEIIIGSIRHMKDIVDSFAAGAHIVTAPLEIIEKMAIHPKTTESVNQFLAEFSQWIN